MISPSPAKNVQATSMNPESTGELFLTLWSITEV